MKWLEKSYRRNLIDMHIEDWNPDFLSKLDSEEYVKALKKSNVKSAMIYSQSHVGLCYWPSEFGNMHKGLKGRDFLGEIIDNCHKEQIDVVIYFSVMYDNWAYEKYPHARIVNSDNEGTRKRNYGGAFLSSRYGICCPNNMEYRAYIKAQIEDLCNLYDFEGMYFDMLFWPNICHCEACKARYKSDVSNVWPEKIDWSDENWLKFQEKREEWMTEFALFITETTKKAKPEVSVQHQFASGIFNWRYGLVDSFVEACDYIGGDLYGGIAQQSFICKLYRGLTKLSPFEYQSSICDPNLQYHTILKTEDYMKLHNYVSLAHGGAFMFIDAIDPDGSIHPKRYEMMGRIFSQSEKYEKEMGGVLQKNVAVYYSFKSKMELSSRGADEAYLEFPHIKSVMEASETLRRGHIAHSVITKFDIFKEADYDVIILPEICFMDSEETTFFEKFISEGGSLYCSKYAQDEVMMKIFGIEEIFGQTHEDFTYISPKTDDALSGFTPELPLSIGREQTLVKAINESDVKATLIRPYTDPEDKDKFASIHSNPPGIKTEYPAIISKAYGKGSAVWSSAPIECEVPDGIRDVFLDVIKGLIKKPLIINVNLPSAIEILVFKKEYSYIVNIVNEQDKLPLVKAANLEISIFVGDTKIKEITRIGSNKNIPFEKSGGYINFVAEELEFFDMYSMKFE